MHRQFIHLLLILALAVMPLQGNAFSFCCERMSASEHQHPLMTMQDDCGHHDCCEHGNPGDDTHCGCTIAHAPALMPALTPAIASLAAIYHSSPSILTTTRAVSPPRRPPRSAV